MKKATKRLLAFVLCVVFSAAFCLFSSALSTNEYGLGLSVTAQETSDKANVSIILNNANNFDVSGITINHSIPDGLALSVPDAADPHDSSTVNLLTVNTLEAGGSYEAELTFIPLASPASAAVTDEAERTNPIAVIIFAAVLIAAFAAAIIISKRNKKAAATVMAFILMLPVFSMYGVHAFGIGDTRSFTLEDSVILGGTAYPLSITVSYNASTAKNSYFEIEADSDGSYEENTCVTRPTADFSGTATADSTVMSVTYEVRSGIDSFEVGSSGEAVLNGCDWSIEDLPLKHGDNTVTFTATLENGETQTYTQDIYYDAGEVYRRTKSEEAEEDGTKYVKEIINIYFDIDTTDERINEILAEIGAQRVGEANDIAMVQARVEAEDLDALNKICEEIEKYDEVTGAGIEQILPLEINVTTNDPWSVSTSHKETINEDIPGGYNWHAEAIRAYSAWKYDSFFSKATVGIVDGPIMTDHEDMLDTIKFTDSYENDNVFSTVAKTKASQYHGTHVASIIGATPDNSIGLSGILWDADIYAANFSSSTDTIGYIASAVSSQVTNGATAINLSLGLNPTPTDTFNPYENPYTTEYLDGTAEQCVLAVSSLLDSGKEFVVVQSAGNGVIDTRLGTNVYRSADATQNGLFCSVRRNTRYGSLSTSKVNKVYDRIIVAGAASNQSNNANGLLFEMAYFSNAGSRVDIYAPGYSIFGATTPQANSSGTYNIMYGIASGTSQAAPLVTSVAALCFAINPNFTGAQVKELICAEENTRCVVYDYSNMQKGLDGNYYDIHPFTGNGRMLDMKLVTEAALRTVCGKANYTQLNRIVAAAQSLDPDTFTNYEIVQDVIDSIDYNLYEYQQDEVDAKYIELIDAMDKLIERTPADYTKVEEAKAQAAALNPDDYVDFSGVTAAVNAVVYGKFSDEQAAVDRMAQDILDAIAALEAKASITSGDSHIIADNSSRYIVLTTEYIESLKDALSADGGYSLTFDTNNDGFYSTGATATLSKEGCEDIVYVIAVIGDIDGNGTSDANDAFLARMYALGLLEPTHSVYKIAADADCDGSITENDSILIQNSTLFYDYIFNDYTPGA